MKIIYNPKKPTMSFKYKGHQVKMRPQRWSQSSGGGISLEITVDGDGVGGFCDTDLDDWVELQNDFDLLCEAEFGYVKTKQEVSADLIELVVKLLDQYLEDEAV